ncbi:hypothetical protein CANTEDRAFT_134643 [Yamadazyma tenuis ATCC 10573]|uniref:Uncharacterized protein n=1 Tax=Candida tenuis (strain ATCC 10573 / BCRC 21748 / CBS 615 / JCM 9827 / NBRC 10315 / NRRL Y-1498 / VKM Y-70) TaxID=590646 RepID=G3B327_CANTC|nr:uncharacterized protein CANTEDRAFT_134643 [Yamadazyma tenuis ATCC 10573]EGV64066.1 hypothetical protein CANTEDRAFT_134643 [Yamadazyma tenuis ATCC 10573]
MNNSAPQIEEDQANYSLSLLNLALSQWDALVKRFVGNIMNELKGNPNDQSFQGNIRSLSDGSPIWHPATELQWESGFPTFGDLLQANGESIREKLAQVTGHNTTSAQDSFLEYLDLLNFNRLEGIPLKQIYARLTNSVKAQNASLVLPYTDDGKPATFTEEITSLESLRHPTLCSIYRQYGFTGAATSVSIIQALKPIFFEHHRDAQSFSRIFARMGNDMINMINTTSDLGTVIREEMTGMEERMRSEMTGMEERMRSEMTGMEERMRSEMTGMEERMRTEATAREERMRTEVNGLRTVVREELPALLAHQFTVLFQPFLQQLSTRALQGIENPQTAHPNANTGDYAADGS